MPCGSTGCWSSPCASLRQPGETYEIAGLDECTEMFELAPPDKPFEVYSVNRFVRVKP